MNGFKKRFPLLFSTFLRFSSTMGLSLVIQLYMTDLGATLFDIGLFSALNGIGSVIFSPVWGVFSDGKGRKRYLALSSVLAAAVLFLYPFAPSIGIFLLLVFVFASMNAGFAPIATALASEGSKRRGREISFYNSATSTGNFASKVFMGFFLIWLSVKVSLWLFIIIFAIGVIALFLIKENGPQNPDAGKGKRFLMGIDDLKLMKSSGIWSIYMASFLRQAGTSGSIAVIAVYLVQKVGVSASTVGFLAGLNPLVQIFSTLYFARLVERKNSKFVMVLGIALSALSPFSFALGKNLIGIALAFSVLGFGYGAFISGTTTYISFATASELRGRFMGLFSSSRAMGTIFGPLVSGSLAAFLGYEPMFFVMGALTLAGSTVMAVFFKERRLEGLHFKA